MNNHEVFDDGGWTYGEKDSAFGDKYQVPTDENIRAAVAKVDAQRMMALASIGDASPAEWTDEALNVWIGLMANAKGETTDEG